MHQIGKSDCYTIQRAAENIPWCLPAAEVAFIQVSVDTLCKSNAALLRTGSHVCNLSHNCRQL